MVERVELSLPGTPVELIGPVGNEAPQPAQFGALFPSYARYLVGPSSIAQPCPQIIEHLVRDMNPKWFQLQFLLLAIASGQLNAQEMSHWDLVDRCQQIDTAVAARINSVMTEFRSCRSTYGR